MPCGGGLVAEKSSRGDAKSGPPACLSRGNTGASSGGGGGASASMAGGQQHARTRAEVAAQRWAIWVGGTHASGPEGGLPAQSGLLPRQSLPQHSAMHAAGRGSAEAAGEGVK